MTSLPASGRTVVKSRTADPAVRPHLILVVSRKTDIYRKNFTGPRARGRSALLRCRLHRLCLTGLPPRCFAHRARPAPPSLPGSACAVWLSDTGVALLSDMEKKEKRTLYASLSFGSRQLPIFPGNAVRHQRAAALPLVSPVSHRASASLLRPPGALGSALSAR